MKKIFLLFATLCVAHIGIAQILVNANGFVTTSEIPFIFKVNNSILAGYTGYSGSNSVAFGYGALSNTIGTYNTAVGYHALKANTTGTQNTAVGQAALLRNTEGTYSTAYGSCALSHNSTGTHNAAHGAYALAYNTTGYYNTANGADALFLNTTGYYNTANGYRALYSNKTGYYNTANGSYALYTNTTGSGNTAIGYNTDVSANNLSNATAIGNGVIATASNQVRIGNSSVTSIGGYRAWTNISDGRAKKNIRADVPGLNFINSLQPVTYNLDLDAIDELLKSDDPAVNHLKDSLREARSSGEKEFEAKSREVKQKQVQTGFVAQDVEKIAKSIGYDFSGVDVDEKGIYGLRYAEFVFLWSKPCRNSVKKTMLKMPKSLHCRNLAKKMMMLKMSSLLRCRNSAKKMMLKMLPLFRYRNK